MVEGEPGDLADGTVLVSEKRATADHLDVGDTVRMGMPEGTRSYTVVGIFEDGNPVLVFPFTVTPGTLLDAGFRRPTTP